MILRNFEAKLASGEADLALGAYAKAPRDLRRQQLYTDGYTSITRHDHPKRQRLARLGEFRGAQHVLVTASETGHTAHQIAQQSIEAVIPPERVLLRLRALSRPHWSRPRAMASPPYQPILPNCSSTG